MANSRGVIYEHRAVLYEKIGPGEHPCYFCGKTLAWMTRRGRDRSGIAGDLHTEHLDGDSLNNAPENLVPCCHACNVKHGFKANRIRPGEPKVKTSGGWTRATMTTCQQCGAEFLRAASDSRQYCSRQCADAAKVVQVCKRGHRRRPEATKCYECHKIAYTAYRERRKASQAS